MRTLIYSWEYPPVIYGGLGRAVHGLAESLAGAGHDVVVVTQSHEDAPADSTVNGVRILRATPDPSGPDLGTDIVGWVDAFNVELTAMTQATLGDWQPDIVHGHDWLVAQASIDAADAFQRPLVATIHATGWGTYGGDVSAPRVAGRHARERMLVGASSRTIVCSEAMAAEVAEVIAPNVADITVVPNAVDPEMWKSTPAERAAMRERLGISEGAPLIVLSARLKAFKGGSDAVEALAIIRQRHPDACLVFAGSGDYQAHLETLAADLGVGDGLRFAGFLTAAELAALKGACEVEVASPWYEPFGYAPLEAAAAGTPCVVTATGGLKEVVVHEQTGLHVPVRSPDALAAAVTRVLDDPAFGARLVAGARERIAERYLWPVVADSTVSVYESAPARWSAVAGGDGFVPPGGPSRAPGFSAATVGSVVRAWDEVVTAVTTLSGQLTEGPHAPALCGVPEPVLGALLKATRDAATRAPTAADLSVPGATSVMDDVLAHGGSAQAAIGVVIAGLRQAARAAEGGTAQPDADADRDLAARITRVLLPAAREASDLAQAAIEESQALRSRLEQVAEN
ncbi:MAG TPA: glycosyltransferase family 4 protein [Jiangellaceae bacterium]